MAIMAFKRDPSAPPPRDTYWGDVLFCAYLVTLTQGTNSLFFTFFIFAILSASFSRGMQEGMMVTGASVILFILASLWFEPSARFGFDQTLVRPIYLLTLGYMISYWGGHEITQRRRIKMLQEVNNQLNPRFGYDHAIRVNLERILNFFEAKDCILVLQLPTIATGYLSYHISQVKPRQEKEKYSSIHQDTSNPNAINEELAKILLSLPTSFSGCYHHEPSSWQRYNSKSCLPTPDSVLNSECMALANLLDTNSFLTVPYSQQNGTSGRLYLIPDKHTYSQSEVEFIEQLLKSISRVVESMQLMDELVAESAKHERFRISLDIHDTTIQPYIGLKLGLDALNRQAGTANPLSKDISELLNMTESTIQDLRRYVTNLREDKLLAGESLVNSIKEQADHFKRFYGIDVEVKFDEEIRVNSRIASSVLQIFAEGLSNILRHTRAKKSYLSIHCEDKNMQLEIANEPPSNAKNNVHFTPRSINARAVSLGGSSKVINDAQGYTVVQVNIPL